jgi:hypothetical protein
VTRPHRVEFLYFEGCPNHLSARALLEEVLAEVAPGTPIEVIEAGDPMVAAARRFPGSPTIRVDGRDIEPGFVDTGDYSPRCRVFWTPAGLAAVPPREWIEEALSRPA